MLVILLLFIFACGPLVLIIVFGAHFRRLGRLSQLATFGLAMAWLVAGFIAYAATEDDLLGRAVRADLDQRSVHYTEIARVYDKDHADPWCDKRFTVRLEGGGTTTLEAVGSDLWGPFDALVKAVPAH